MERMVGFGGRGDEEKKGGLNRCSACQSEPSVASFLRNSVSSERKETETNGLSTSGFGGSGVFSSSISTPLKESFDESGFICRTPPTSPLTGKKECPPSPSPLRTCPGPLRVAKRPRSRLFEGDLQDETRRLSLEGNDLPSFDITIGEGALFPPKGERERVKRARNNLFGNPGSEISLRTERLNTLLTPPPFPSAPSHHSIPPTDRPLSVPNAFSSSDNSFLSIKTPTPSPSFVTPQNKSLRTPQSESLAPRRQLPTPNSNYSNNYNNYNNNYNNNNSLFATPGRLCPKSPLRNAPPKSPSRPTLPRFTHNPWSPRPPVKVEPRTFGQPDLNTLQNTNLYSLLFKEVGMLGEGSFGRVYQCRHIVDGWDYAVKISKKPLRGTKDLDGKLQEVFALAALPGHPNLVRYHNSWIYNSLLYIQTEFCDGGNLFGEIKKRQRPFSEKELCDMLLQLASGLDCLHSHKMVHKDIKPENIYICSGTAGQENKKWYKIGDMGLIKGSQRTNDSLFDFDFDDNDGDCRYLAPEVLNAPSTPQSDIFSLGMSMIHLATGIDPPKQMYQREKGASHLPAEFSTQFRELLGQMVDADPLERPTAKELLRHPLLVSGGNASIFEEMAEENELLKKEVAVLKEQLLLLTKFQASRKSALSSPRRF